MYMSYCRHEGTLTELIACLEDATEHMNEEAAYSVSNHEIGKFQEMVEYFFNWCDESGLIDEYGELKYERLEEICESMKKGYGEEDDQA